MSDTITEVQGTPASEGASSNGNGQASAAGFDFADRYGDVIGKVNETLGKVDWNQVSRFSKAGGILLAVIVAQILIKGVLDTINLLPLVPGLLELLGLVVVGTWSWNNLTTSEKRSKVMAQVQTLRKEYLG